MDLTSSCVGQSFSPNAPRTRGLEGDVLWSFKEGLVKKGKKRQRPNASEKFSMLRLRLVLGFGNIKSLVSVARMISVKPDCLKWLDTSKNNGF